MRNLCLIVALILTGCLGCTAPHMRHIAKFNASQYRWDLKLPETAVLTQP